MMVEESFIERRLSLAERGFGVIAPALDIDAFLASLRANAAKDAPGAIKDSFSSFDGAVRDAAEDDEISLINLRNGFSDLSYHLESGAVKAVRANQLSYAVQESLSEYVAQIREDFDTAIDRSVDLVKAKRMGLEDASGQLAESLLEISKRLAKLRFFWEEAEIKLARESKSEDERTRTREPEMETA